MSRPGMVFNGRYELVHQLGRGAFADVYLANDKHLPRQVAVKVLHPILTVDRDFLIAFSKEAELSASLQHPNILTVHDYGSDNGLFFLVTPYIVGATKSGKAALSDKLSELIEDGELLGLDQAVRYVAQAASALDYAHRRRVVHRDVKPQNMLLAAEGYLLMADFGIARVLDATATAYQGRVIGTPPYMAPEQWRGMATPASDIYALGCVLFELMTGSPPYMSETKSALEYGDRHRNDPIPSIGARRSIPFPRGLQGIIERALAKAPEDRYPSAQTFAQALEAVMSAKDEEYRSLWDPSVTEHLGRATSALQPTHESPRGTRGFCQRFNHGSVYLCPEHGAQPVRHGINYYFDQRGGTANRLGFPITPERKAVRSPAGTDGALQRFESTWDYSDAVLGGHEDGRFGATVYYSERYGAFSTWGGIGECYEVLGGTGRRLGFPTSEEREIGPSARGHSGWSQQFEGGVIYWCEAYEAHAVAGAIGAYHASLRRTLENLGFPTSPEYDAAPSHLGTTGTVQRFEARRDYPNEILGRLFPDHVSARMKARAAGSSIYWSEKYGAHGTWGGIGKQFELLRGTDGPLGFPTSDEVEVGSSVRGTSGVYQLFEDGVICYCKSHSVRAVYGNIGRVFLGLGGLQGPFGFPVSDIMAPPPELLALDPALADSGVSVQQFEGGWLYEPMARAQDQGELQTWPGYRPTVAPTLLSAELVVHSDGSGTHPTLAAAIAAAPPGATILLGSGTHHVGPGLRLDKALELRGSGMDQTIVTADSGDAVLLHDASAELILCDLTCQWTGDRDAKAEVVIIAAGQVHIERCRFTGAPFTAEGWTGSGLLFRGDAMGTVAHCRMEHNGYGIEVTGHAHPLLVENSCQHNQYSGIVYFKDAWGTARRNVSSDNGRRGILLSGQAAPVLDGNICARNPEGGIVLHKDARPQVRGNQCRENGLDGIFIPAEANVLLALDNVCIGNKRHEINDQRQTQK